LFVPTEATSESPRVGRVRRVAGWLDHNDLVAFFLKLAALLAAFTLLLTTCVSSVRWVQRNYDSPERVAVRHLEFLRVGMTREEFSELLGAPFTQRSVRANPFGVTRRAAYYKRGVYAVVALFNSANASVYYAVTSLTAKVDPRIPLPSRATTGAARLNTSALGTIGCDQRVVGFRGLDWSDFSLACGGSDADDASWTFVGWNPYSTASRSGDVMRAQDSKVFGFDGQRDDVATQDCLRDANYAVVTYGAEWRADFERACETPELWEPQQTEKLFRSAPWQRALRHDTVDTFAVTAATVVDPFGVDFFVFVMNGPGPCKFELQGGGCGGWI
jgi:hypothetical protein